VRHWQAFGVTSGAVMNSVAWRLPSVMVRSCRGAGVHIARSFNARPLIASTLYCTGDPCRDADGESNRDRRRIRQTAATQVQRQSGRFRVNGERLQRDDRQQEDDGETGEQNAERISLAFSGGCAFNQGDHAVEEGLAGLR